MSSAAPRLSPQMPGEDIDSLLPTPDAVSDWISLHAEEVHAHRGNVIAVHPLRGILAWAPTYRETSRKVDALSLPAEEIDQVVLSPVPEAL